MVVFTIRLQVQFICLYKEQLAVQQQVGIYPAFFHFVDSPNTTSECSYQLQITAGASYNVNLFVNRTSNDTDADYGARTSSSITAMEIGG